MFLLIFLSLSNLVVFHGLASVLCIVGHDGSKVYCLLRKMFCYILVCVCTSNCVSATHRNSATVCSNQHVLQYCACEQVVSCIDVIHSVRIVVAILACCSVSTF